MNQRSVNKSSLDFELPDWAKIELSKLIIKGKNSKVIYPTIEKVMELIKQVAFDVHCNTKEDCADEAIADFVRLPGDSDEIEVFVIKSSILDVKIRL